MLGHRHCLLLEVVVEQLLRKTAFVLDYVLIVHFDGERSLESSEEFVREVIVDQLHARFVVVGEDYAQQLVGG